MASLCSVFANKQKGTSLGIALAGLLAVSSAEAVLTDNITIGNAKALGLGHAVTADPPGIDSVHYNPAGLTRLKGQQQEIKLISGFFNIELEFGEGYTESWDRTVYQIDNSIAHDSPEWFNHIDQVIANSPDGFHYDESNGSTSETEGAALMLPFVGLTEIPVILAPLGGASYSPPGSNITFATNVYSPLMVGFNRADDDPGRFMGEQLAFSLITYFSPSVAVQLNDTLSVGAAITFNYAGVGLNLAFREPNFGLQWLERLRDASCLQQGENPLADGALEFEDFIPCIPEDETVRLYETLGVLKFEVENNLTFGMNLGVLWEAMPWLHLGAVYQAPVKMDMEGDFSWDQGQGLLNFFQQLEANFGGGFSFAGLGDGFGALTNPRTTGEAKVEMTMPAHMSFGFSLQVTPSIKLNADYKWSEWSEWAEIPVQFSEPIGVIFLANLLQPDAAPSPGGYQVNFPLGLEDTWNLAIGLEYQWNDKLALRVGYEDRPSSIPKEARSPLLPIGDSTLYSIGANYRMSPEENLEFAIATMSSEVHMPGNTSVLGNAEDYQLFIYNPYSGNDITARLDVLLLEMSYRKRF